MTTRIVIRLDERQREKLNQLSRAEGKTTSQVVRELIDTFIKKHDNCGYIDNLWNRIGHTLSKNGYVANDIPRMIRESRKAYNR